METAMLFDLQGAMASHVPNNRHVGVLQVMIALVMHPRLLRNARAQWRGYIADHPAGWKDLRDADVPRCLPQAFFFSFGMLGLIPRIRRSRLQ